MKVDPHRHMGGCVPSSFVWSMIQERGLTDLADTESEVVRQMTFQPGEPAGFHRFLDKFKILDEIDWTPYFIDKSIKAIADDLDADNVGYAWIDFSINKYMSIGWGKQEAIAFIHNSFERHRPNGVGLVLSLKYESMRASQRQYASLIEHEDTAKFLVGIDLVGDEQYFDHGFYRPIFHDWKKAGKMTRAHVGESQALENVVAAMETMGVTNVAHGLKILGNDRAMGLARDLDVTFDMAITSNHLTGVWTDQTKHPSLDMHRANLKVTLGSDDPIQCSTTLGAEIKKAAGLGWTAAELDAAGTVARLNAERHRPSTVPAY